MIRHLIASLFVAMPAVAAAEERLVQPPQPGFVVANIASDERQTIAEAVPRGESVERWTRMITTQRFVGLVTNGASADGFLARLARVFETSCPGARVTMLPAFALRVDCPLNGQTGLPETMLTRVFSGKSDLHSLQVAFRRVPTAADLRWAQAHLAAATLCGAAADAAACDARRPAARLPSATRGKASVSGKTRGAP